MSLMGKNIAANLAGGLILTAMMLVLTPLQLRLLGKESYGVIGIITALQLAFTAFDFGLSSTLTRELATDRSASRRTSHSLIRTALTIYWCCAILIGLTISLNAGVMARQWFNATTIPEVELVRSLQVIALYLALRWPVAVYAGILTGTQQIATLNVIKVSVLGIRMVGGIAVLLLEPTLIAFLVWTSASAALEIVVYDLTCRRVIRDFPARPGFCVEAVKKVWRFSAKMSGLALLAVIIVQADRVVISKLLPLEALGTYNLAYTAASALLLVINAVSTAVLPSLAAIDRGEDLVRFERERVRADRIMLYLVTPVSAALVLFGKDILTLWVGASDASGAYIALAILSAGFWISAAIANVYNAAVAIGDPSWHLRANIFVTVPYCLLLYAMVSRFGIEGAGLSWLILNGCYALILVPIVESRVLHGAYLGWLSRIVVPFLVLSVASFAIPYQLAAMAGVSHGRWSWLLLLAVSGVLWLLASIPLGVWTQAKALYRSFRHNRAAGWVR